MLSDGHNIPVHRCSRQALVCSSRLWIFMAWNTTSKDLSIGSNATEAYFTPPGSIGSYSDNATHMKQHEGEYRQVYRLLLPADGSLTRQYIINCLPRLNLSGRISRLGDQPAATNGAFGDIWLGTVDGGRKVAVKVVRASMASDAQRVERESCCLCQTPHLTEHRSSKLFADIPSRTLHVVSPHSQKRPRDDRLYL